MLLTLKSIKIDKPFSKLIFDCKRRLFSIKQTNKRIGRCRCVSHKIEIYYSATFVCINNTKINSDSTLCVVIFFLYNTNKSLYTHCWFSNSDMILYFYYFFWCASWNNMFLCFVFCLFVLFCTFSITLFSVMAVSNTGHLKFFTTLTDSGLPVKNNYNRGSTKIDSWSPGLYILWLISDCVKVGRIILSAKRSVGLVRD